MKNGKPRVSVIMAVYNVEAYIMEAIKSIQEQTFLDWEIVAVDDCSTDGTEEILRRIAEDDNRIRVLRHSENKGVAATRNYAAEQSTGKYLCVMDPDDVSFPSRLEKQYTYLENHPSVVAVSAWPQIIDADSEIIYESAIDISYKEPAILRRRLMQGNQIVHSAVMMKKEGFFSVGAYRNVFRIGEDYDLWLRLNEIGDIVCLDERLVQYRRSHSSVTLRNPASMMVLDALIRQCARTRRDGESDESLIRSFVDQYGELKEEDAIELVSANELAIAARDLAVSGYSECRIYAAKSLSKRRGLTIKNLARNLLILTYLYGFLQRIKDAP